jgi:hypothetical protein
MSSLASTTAWPHWKRRNEIAVGLIVLGRKELARRFVHAGRGENKSAIAVAIGRSRSL